MKEIAEHVLDIVQNSLFSGASGVEIDITEDLQRDRIRVMIKDNGCGMDEDLLAKVLDPFVTTRSKRTGLGLPLLAQTAELANGEVKISSQVKQGTQVYLDIQRSHWDCPPLGNVVDTVVSCLSDHVELMFVHRLLGLEGGLVGEVVLDTKEIKEELDGVSVSHPEVLLFIRKMLIQEYQRLEGSK